MKTLFMRALCVAAALLIFTSAPPAQTYPTRTITLIVPFAPGGPADLLARLIGQKLSEDLGQQIVVENRPGANTILGARRWPAKSDNAVDGDDARWYDVPLQQARLRSFAISPDTQIAVIPSVLGQHQTPVQSVKDVSNGKASRQIRSG
jgi:hypothetical protein